MLFMMESLPRVTHMEQPNVFFNYLENLVKRNIVKGMEANRINYKHAKRIRKTNQMTRQKNKSQLYCICYISGISIFVSRNLATLFESGMHIKKVSWENLFKFNGCLFYSFLRFYSVHSGKAHS